MDYKIGDKVVYPNHGVGVIEQINSRTIGPSVQKFYLLRIKSSSLRVEVPFNNVGTVGLRPVVKNGEVTKIINFLFDGKCDNHLGWKCRVRENCVKLRPGSLVEVGVVLQRPPDRVAHRRATLDESGWAPDGSPGLHSTGCVPAPWPSPGRSPPGTIRASPT